MHICSDTSIDPNSLKRNIYFQSLKINLVEAINHSDCRYIDQIGEPRSITFVIQNMQSFYQ